MNRREHSARRRTGFFLTAFWALTLWAAEGLAQQTGGALQGELFGAAAGPKNGGAAAPPTLKGNARSIGYGAPFNCRPTVARPTVSCATPFAAGIERSNGGKSDAIWNGRVVIKTAPADGVAYPLINSRHVVWDQGALPSAQ